MDSNTNSPQKASPETKAAGQGSASICIEARQPYAQSQPCRNNLLVVGQAERQPNDYSLERWLCQSPPDEPWNVVSGFGGQRPNETGSTQVKVEGEEQSREEPRRKGGESPASFDS